MRILMATDFSTRSDRALRRAVLIARQNKAELTLVHVVDDDQPAYLIDRNQMAAAHLLDRAARTIREVDEVGAQLMVITGDAFTGILESAEATDADLIVIGPHRRHLLDVFTGTTAERTIQRTRWPILMANAFPSHAYDHVLLAIDTDNEPDVVIDAAKQLGFADGKLMALHLVDTPALSIMQQAMETPAAVDHYRQNEVCRASSEFDAFLTWAGLPDARPVLRPHDGSTALAILAAAEEQSADLIIVGSSQKSGFERLLLRSVAEEVLLDAKRDVLVVPM